MVKNLTAYHYNIYNKVLRSIAGFHPLNKTGIYIKDAKLYCKFCDKITDSILNFFSVYGVSYNSKFNLSRLSNSYDYVFWFRDETEQPIETSNQENSIVITNHTNEKIESVLLPKELIDQTLKELRKKIEGLGVSQSIIEVNKPVNQLVEEADLDKIMSELEDMIETHLDSLIEDRSIMNQYIIKKGDTFIKIADQLEKNWKELYKFNLNMGQVFKLDAKGNPIINVGDIIYYDETISSIVIDTPIIEEEDTSALSVSEYNDFGDVGYLDKFLTQGVIELIPSIETLKLYKGDLELKQNSNLKLGTFSSEFAVIKKFISKVCQYYGVNCYISSFYRTSANSLHSKGRAIDISRVYINDKEYKLHEFYNSIRDKTELSEDEWKLVKFLAGLILCQRKQFRLMLFSGLNRKMTGLKKGNSNLYMSHKDHLHVDWNSLEELD